MISQIPNWSLWVNYAEVRVRDAVALSLNVAPEFVADSPNHVVSRMPRFDEFCQRMSIAVSHLKQDTLHAEQRGEDCVPYVQLSTFREWGESLYVPFTYPEEFPKAKVSSANTTREKPLEEKERASLLNIIAAMRDLLLDKDGGKFPSQAKIIDVLIERAGHSMGLSKRNLEKAFAAKR